jgi:hypothetical protein
MNIFGSILLLVIFLITLVSTFTFLQNKNLNLIPLFSLFIVSISIIVLFVNAIRFKVLRKIEEGEYILDDDFFKLYILKKYFEQENMFKMKNQKEKKSHELKEDKISDEDAPNNENNLKNTFSDFIEEVDISKYLADAIRKKSNN